MLFRTITIIEVLEIVTLMPLANISVGCTYCFGKQNLLAHRTSPIATFTIYLQIRFQVKALNVFAFVSSRWQHYPFECDRTFKRNL